MPFQTELSTCFYFFCLNEKGTWIDQEGQFKEAIAAQARWFFTQKSATFVSCLLRSEVSNEKVPLNLHSYFYSETVFVWHELN